MITSSCTNLSCADMNNLLLIKSSDKTVAVALDVWPVTISPLWNLPNPESSNNILSPASKDVLSVSNLEASNTKLFVCAVSVSNWIPSVNSIFARVISADYINL